MPCQEEDRPEKKSLLILSASLVSRHPNFEEHYFYSGAISEWIDSSANINIFSATLVMVSANLFLLPHFLTSDYNTTKRPHIFHVLVYNILAWLIFSTSVQHFCYFLLCSTFFPNCSKLEIPHIFRFRFNGTNSVSSHELINLLERPLPRPQCHFNFPSTSSPINWKKKGKTDNNRGSPCQITFPFVFAI